MRAILAAVLVTAMATGAAAEAPHTPLGERVIYQLLMARTAALGCEGMRVSEPREAEQLVAAGLLPGGQEAVAKFPVAKATLTRAYAENPVRLGALMCQVLWSSYGENGRYNPGLLTR